MIGEYTSFETHSAKITSKKKLTSQSCNEFSNSYARNWKSDKQFYIMISVIGNSLCVLRPIQMIQDERPLTQWLSQPNLWLKMKNTSTLGRLIPLVTTIDNIIRITRSSEWNTINTINTCFNDADSGSLSLQTDLNVANFTLRTSESISQMKLHPTRDRSRCKSFWRGGGVANGYSERNRSEKKKKPASATPGTLMRN